MCVLPENVCVHRDLYLKENQRVCVCTNSEACEQKLACVRVLKLLCASDVHRCISIVDLTMNNVVLGIPEEYSKEGQIDSDAGPNQTSKSMRLH